MAFNDIYAEEPVTSRQVTADFDTRVGRVRKSPSGWYVIGEYATSNGSAQAAGRLRPRHPDCEFRAVTRDGRSKLYCRVRGVK